MSDEPLYAEGPSVNRAAPQLETIVLFQWDGYDCPALKLLAELNEVISRVPEQDRKDIVASICGEDEDSTLCFLHTRMETEDEARARMRKEREWLENRERDLKLELARHKRMYGDK